MILRANISNLYSFNEETEISFVAGKSPLHPEQVIRSSSRDDISVLKAGIIYGANASGKSNIIHAISLLQKIALGSIPKRSIEPFKLKDSNNQPSKVELEIKVGKQYFAYGVEFTIKGVVEEWLYEINDRSDKKVYTRKVTIDGNDFSFGTIDGTNEAQQLIKFISQSTPTTDSFLSEYIKRNGKGISAISVVHTWMKENLKIILPDSRYDGLSVRAEKDEDFAQATKSLLEYFNTGIVDIRRIEIRKEDVDLPKEILTQILSDAEPGKNVVISSSDDHSIYFFETNEDAHTTVYKQKAIHKTIDHVEIPFEMSEESDGSLRLLDFIPMLIDFRLNEAVYLVDEIDRSMHPILSYKLLEYYLTNLSENHDTQLICSTHESNLLSLDLIRADEVWFVEKGNDGASHLTSLAEYKPRQEIRKGYLQGRYGAIPFFAPIKSLKW